VFLFLFLLKCSFMFRFQIRTPYRRSFCNYISKVDKSLGLSVHPSFINEEEEKVMIDELLPLFERKRYQTEHWDKVITGYRELEKMRWNDRNIQIIQRMKDMFPANTRWLPAVHILDLDEKGHIAPHVDSVKFSGSIVAGLCLLSDCLMKLRDENSNDQLELFLPRRCFYIMSNASRYKYTHEIPPNNPDQDVFFEGKIVKRTRRISIILRNELDCI